jgi:hypothetical protein
MAGFHDYKRGFYHKYTTYTVHIHLLGFGLPFIILLFGDPIRHGFWFKAASHTGGRRVWPCGHQCMRGWNNAVQNWLCRLCYVRI